MRKQACDSDSGWQVIGRRRLQAFGSNSLRPSAVKGEEFYEKRRGLIKKCAVKAKKTASRINSAKIALRKIRT